MALEYGKSIEDLMNELTTEKLHQAPPKTVLQPEIEEVEENESIFITESSDFGADDVEEAEEPNIKDITGLPELIVGIIDIFAASVAEAWTQTAEKGKYRLEADEKEELTKAWKMYLQNSEDVKISPSTMLILTTCIIYTPKAIQAFNERKINKQQWKQVES